ncbi:MAG: ATP synthase F1 subunit gamma, partial [SAR324 cluster bacterium]|nr:ATP synthase F1 subunit gamma [SAR324 cluster bacterium]
MATLRDIKRRITSVTSTQKITNAMKMISAAKLNRAQLAVRAAQPYAEKLRQMVTTMAAGMSGDDHPFFEAREGSKTVVIHFTSDRGLCGGFNSNLNRMVNASRESGELGAEVELVLFGRKGNDFFRRRNVPIARALVQLRETERRGMIREVREDLVARFLTGEISRVMLAYNHYYNPIRQLPVILPLLPVTAPQGEQGAALDDREILFEPDRGAILDTLLPANLQ